MNSPYATAVASTPPVRRQLPAPTAAVGTQIAALSFTDRIHRELFSHYRSDLR